MGMFSTYTQIKSATGVALHIQQDNKIIVNACKIAVRNQQLDFEQKVTGLKSIDECNEKLALKSIVALNITGKGVLIKRVAMIAKLDQQNFSGILPNARFEDFYCQNFISGEYSFIAVIRKTDANHWIAKIVNQGFNVVMLSLGPFPVSSILPQLNSYGEEAVFDGHMITKNEDGSWKAYRYDVNARSPFPLKIETEKIDEQLLVPYAAAFQLVMAEQADVVQANVDSLQIAYTHVLSSHKVKTYGALIAVVFFIALLLNFFVFSWLDAENTKLSYQASRSAQNHSDIRGIEDQIKSKEQKLKTLGWDGGINKAVLIDNLAGSLPPEITWKQIAINPIDRSVSRNQKALTFKDRQITVIGLSQKILPVNEWMARVKTYKWVKDIQLENYAYNSEVNNGQFTLTITY